MIELLAPAKDKICAKAAIDYGADAIYIGANEFGARKKAANSISDIAEIVQYAHKFNVRVYATINTILTDDEIIKAKKLINELSKIGVDAIIIQDRGLLEDEKFYNFEKTEVIHTKKYLKFHASTQCDNRTAEKVKFLENAGFSRVILARELSIEQIKDIRNQTNIELETFIHGALCVSYSGQCYLSQLIGGRSANRGECAQPCRKKYSLVDEDGKFIAKDKYLLCLKDFNASKHIKELADAGVTSFKIEGRLKDVNYVKNVVAYYRKLIDDLGYEKTSSGKILFDFEPDLERSFNRGFTDYFLKKRNECYSFLTPKSIGKYLGKVKKIGKDYFEIVSNLSINPQDGLCFFDNDELNGCLVNKVEGNKIYPNKMPKIILGTDIYRNFDSEFEKILKTSKTCRKLSVNIYFNLNNIKAIDECGNSTEIEYNFEEFAQNEEKMAANIITQLKKSGESYYLVDEVKIQARKLPFLPISKLNELRRELLYKLDKNRSDILDRQPKENQIQVNIADNKGLFENNLIVDYRANILNKSAKEFYEKHGYKVAEMALESGENCNPKTAMITKHCLKYAFNMCKSPKQLYLIDEKGKRYELKFNCDKCEMEIIF